MSNVHRSIENQRVVVIGGSSGIGLAIAKAAVADGAKVVIASRSAEKLRQASLEIGSAVESRPLDLTQEETVMSFFQELGTIDHLVVSGSSVKTGSLKQLAVADARSSFDSKFWGPYLATKHAQINANGSIVLFSGILSRRPTYGLAGLAAINAAVEALGRALALELAPVRVNVISPGLVDTPAYSGMPDEQRQAFYESVKKSLPVQRIGVPENIAAAVLYLMGNPYVTGTVLDVDGGALLVGVSPH